MMDDVLEVGNGPLLVCRSFGGILVSGHCNSTHLRSGSSIARGASWPGRSGGKRKKAARLSRERLEVTRQRSGSASGGVKAEMQLRPMSGVSSRQLQAKCGYES